MEYGVAAITAIQNVVAIIGKRDSRFARYRNNLEIHIAFVNKVA